MVRTLAKSPAACASIGRGSLGTRLRHAHPYDDLPPEAVWNTGVEGANRQRMPGLHVPRFAIGRQTAVATAGGCFARHITRTPRRAGATVLDAEPPPRAMPQEVQRRYGYGLFSGRYGNVYTARQMRQLLEEVAAGAADAAYFPSYELVMHRGLATDPIGAYVAGAPRLTPEGGATQPKDDILHASAAYGAADLSQVAAALAG